ncbi:uroporphyrinogen-III synthase [Phyllobacterium sp. LjRoot231]|uniref:uroporphyrinogen-III synthase n=1 Tax=Phyllobacterium sp. LjRoot231 TaxID=3342289 RepID=UPI003ECD079B
MAKTVLVTRPQPGATRTAERLRGLGYEPLVLPLTEIAPVPVTLPARSFDAVAITSANALRHAPEEFLGSILDLPCFVVGDVTADLARRIGFKNVSVGDGDGDSLGETLDISVKPGARILYLTGRVRAPDFEESILAHGRQIDPLPVYGTDSVSYSTDFLIDFFSNRGVNICLLYSRRGAEAFLQLLERVEFDYLFENTKFICLSNRIADVLEGKKITSISVAKRPNEAALFDLLPA